MEAKILWVEGNRAARPAFVSGLRRKGYEIETVATGKAALIQIPRSSPDLVVVNAASMRSNGKRICHSIRDSVDGLPILLITDSKKDSQDEFQVNEVLALPFTIRKLVNRIEPLIPGESDHVMQRGPIKYDLERKQVFCEEREAKLTPRLGGLLKMFLEQPGVVLERERLFKQVWRTEYTGDTRTLDVHISWLRAAIEKNPRKPKFLKTIRGVGYRLDV